LPLPFFSFSSLRRRSSVWLANSDYLEQGVFEKDALDSVLPDRLAVIFRLLLVPMETAIAVSQFRQGTT
jgi:hypothetical protein